MKTTIEKIEFCAFACEAGPLAMNKDWKRLKLEISQLEEARRLAVKSEALAWETRDSSYEHLSERIKYLKKALAFEVESRKRCENDTAEYTSLYNGVRDRLKVMEERERKDRIYQEEFRRELAASEKVRKEAEAELAAIYRQYKEKEERDETYTRKISEECHALAAENERLREVLNDIKISLEGDIAIARRKGRWTDWPKVLFDRKKDLRTLCDLI